MFKMCCSRKYPPVPISVGGGGGTGGFPLPLPIPFNPGCHPVFVGSRLFVFFPLQNIACCIIFPFFSCFLPPWECHFPPRSSTSRTPPAPFSPAPCPPPCFLREGFWFEPPNPSGNFVANHDESEINTYIKPKLLLQETYILKMGGVKVKISFISFLFIVKEGETLILGYPGCQRLFLDGFRL